MMDDNENSEEKDGFGLDKNRRLVERRERTTEEQGPEPLDPPFPYRVISPDSFLAGWLAGS